jgi:hypothetical protein
MDAHVLVRRTFRERVHVRRAVAVEAVMEELSTALEGDVETWALAGLLADLDCEAAQNNPGRRGMIAADMLAGEDVPATVIEAVRERWADEPPGPLAAALAVATLACEALLRAAGGGASIERMSASVIEGALMADGRTARALLALNIDAQRAATLCLEGVRRVRTDLGMVSGAAEGSAR